MALDRSSLEQVAIREINSIQTPHRSCETPFEIGEMRQDGPWAFMTLVCWPPESEEPVEVVVPEVILFAIAYNGDSGWEVYLEGTENYFAKLVDIPDSLLSNESKDHLLASSVNPLAPQVPSSPQAYSTGLPWQRGSTWYYRQSIHGGNNALDFASPCGTVGEVRAADGGVVVWAYETCILVRRSDGLEIGYQHIASADIVPWDPGDVIYSGTLLGHTTMESGCSGYTQAHHVHFWLQNQNPNGSTFGGWTLNDPWLVKGSSSRYPNLGCVNGSNDIYYEGGCCGCGSLVAGKQEEDPWASAARTAASSIAVSSDPPFFPDLPASDNVSVELESGSPSQEISVAETFLPKEPENEMDSVALPVTHTPLDSQRTPPASTNYRIPKSVFGSGGGPKTSTHYVLNATQGQSTDLSRRESASYVLSPGYWGSAAAGGSGHKVYLPLVIKDH